MIVATLAFSLAVSGARRCARGVRLRGLPPWRRERSLAQRLERRSPVSRRAPPFGLVLSELVLFVVISTLKVVQRS
jgi:hypothetical protein